VVKSAAPAAAPDAVRQASVLPSTKSRSTLTCPVTWRSGSAPGSCQVPVTQPKVSGVSVEPPAVSWALISTSGLSPAASTRKNFTIMEPGPEP